MPRRLMTTDDVLVQLLDSDEEFTEFTDVTLQVSNSNVSVPDVKGAVGVTIGSKFINKILGTEAENLKRFGLAV